MAAACRIMKCDERPTPWPAGTLVAIRFASSSVYAPLLTEALVPKSPTRNEHRDLLLARALGLSLDQIRQVPEYIREFGITLLCGETGGER